MSEEAYCEAVLAASLAAPPGPPTFDEHPHVDGGPNRFVVFDGPAGGEPRRVEMNRLLLQFHPLSVHDAFGPTGRRVGSFAPGVSFVPSAEATAEEVSVDAVTTAAIAVEVESCTRTGCDPFVRAALAAEGDAKVGRPVSLT